MEAYLDMMRGPPLSPLQASILPFLYPAQRKVWVGMNCRDPEALYHLIHSCKDPYDRYDKGPITIYHVADERKCDHFQLLRQRPIIPQAAPACQRSIPADIEPSVAWGVG